MTKAALYIHVRHTVIHPSSTPVHHQHLVYTNQPCYTFAIQTGTGTRSVIHLSHLDAVHPDGDGHRHELRDRVRRLPGGDVAYQHRCLRELKQVHNGIHQHLEQIGKQINILGTLGTLQGVVRGSLYQGDLTREFILGTL